MVSTVTKKYKTDIKNATELKEIFTGEGCESKSSFYTSSSSFVSFINSVKNGSITNLGTPVVSITLKKDTKTEDEFSNVLIDVDYTISRTQHAKLTNWKYYESAAGWYHTDESIAAARKNFTSISSYVSPMLPLTSTPKTVTFPRSILSNNSNLASCSSYINTSDCLTFFGGNLYACVSRDTVLSIIKKTFTNLKIHNKLKPANIGTAFVERAKFKEIFTTKEVITNKCYASTPTVYNINGKLDSESGDITFSSSGSNNLKLYVPCDDISEIKGYGLYVANGKTYAAIVAKCKFPFEGQTYGTGTVKDIYIAGCLDLDAVGISNYNITISYKFKTLEQAHAQASEEATKTGSSIAVGGVTITPPTVQEETQKVEEQQSLSDLSVDTSNLYKMAAIGSPYVNVHSIIGLPFSFLANADLRYSSGNPSRSNQTVYGKEYLENIIYDMPIVGILPGEPTTGGSVLGQALIAGLSSYLGFGGNKYDLASALGLAAGAAATSLIENSRMYLFEGAYTEYTQYVNTMCHIFAAYLGISDLKAPVGYSPSIGNGTYGQYDDTISQVDKSNDQFTQQFGSQPAIFIYAEPSSDMSNSFSTSTASSEIEGVVNDISDKSKQWKFMAQSFGLGNNIKNLYTSAAQFVGDLAGAVFGNVGSLIIGSGANALVGNNIDLPEMWADSNSEASYTVKVKLASPYGDPESVFLYVLRPLARLLALTLPRQTGMNSYSSPFIVRAFSKGQFNTELGIITNMSITKGGNGAESYTIHHLPTEMEVQFTIKDMYSMIMMSNEFRSAGAIKILSLLKTPGDFKLLFGNIGYLDFLASYSGFNMNAPATDIQRSLLRSMIKNRVNQGLNMTSDGLRWPAMDKKVQDIFNNAVVSAQSFITT